VGLRQRLAALILSAAVTCPALAADTAPAAPAAKPATPGGVRAAVAAALPTPKGTYPLPTRFENAIRAFEAADAKLTPAPGQIVCVGSSSMAFWNATIGKDLAPLKVIPRGFGGSNMNDALHYVDRVVLRYRPKAVVLYEGDNDIAQGIAPGKIVETFNAFTAAIHKAQPDTRIYVMSIKPSPSRLALWPKSVEANKLLRAACALDPKRLTFVSTVEAMMGADGQVRAGIFRPDRLHMTAAGYALWRDVLRPVLMKGEMPAAVATESPAPTKVDLVTPAAK
jgi:lysophospholipase L1-like esterase